MNAFKILVLVAFLTLMSSFLVRSQTNLVLNPSLEDTLCCPKTREDIFCAKHWYQPNPAGSSTDYFHSCNVSEYHTYAINNGWLSPRTGNAFVLIETFQNIEGLPPRREYLCGSLAKRLNAGECYNIEFYVVPAFWRSFPGSYFGTDRIGIWFLKDSIINTSTSFAPIILTPYVEYNGGIICDTSQWTPVRGQFIAKGNEHHFIIGNFYPDGSTSIKNCHSSPQIPNPQTYLLIDDISVWPCDAPVHEADAGSDKRICFGDEITIGQNLPDGEYRFLWSAQSHQLTKKDSWDTLSVTPYLTVKPTQTTTYYLWLRDFKMDVSYDSVKVFVDACQSLPIIPNVFTPNGDGFNDVFRFDKSEGWNLQTCIRNRWGQVVFEGINDQWWDGYTNGQQAATGVYFYTVTASNRFGQNETFYGAVSLLR